MFLTTRVTACRLPIMIVGNNIWRLLCGVKNYFAYNDEIIIMLRLLPCFLRAPVNFVLMNITRALVNYILLYSANARSVYKYDYIVNFILTTR